MYAKELPKRKIHELLTPVQMWLFNSCCSFHLASAFSSTTSCCTPCLPCFPAEVSSAAAAPKFPRVSALPLLPGTVQDLCPREQNPPGNATPKLAVCRWQRENLQTRLLSFYTDALWDAVKDKGFVCLLILACSGPTTLPLLRNS